MHPIDFTPPSHGEDAQVILRQTPDNFQKSQHDTPINITELAWITAWSSLVRVALYKGGAKVR